MARIQINHCRTIVTISICIALAACYAQSTVLLSNAPSQGRLHFRDFGRQITFSRQETAGSTVLFLYFVGSSELLAHLPEQPVDDFAIHLLPNAVDGVIIAAQSGWPLSCWQFVGVLRKGNLIAHQGDAVRLEADDLLTSAFWQCRASGRLTSVWSLVMNACVLFSAAFAILATGMMVLERLQVGKRGLRATSATTSPTPK